MQTRLPLTPPRATLLLLLLLRVVMAAAAAVLASEHLRGASVRAGAASPVLLLPAPSPVPGINDVVLYVPPPQRLLYNVSDTFPHAL